MRASSRAVPPRTRVSTPRLADLVGDLEAALRLRLRESPMLTLAVAGGFGCVLGGGLTGRVLTRGLALGLRVALASHAEQVFVDWLLMGRGREEARETSKRSRED
jgi:hypothetical protein